MKPFDDNPISVYKKGIENEIYVDNKGFIETNLKDFINYKVFKPYKMASAVKKRPKTYRVIFALISSCWFLLNFLYQTKVFLVVLFKTPWNKTQTFKASKLLIIATPKALEQIKKVENQNIVPNEYLFLGVCKNMSHKKNLGFYQHLSLSIIIKHYFTSIILYKKLQLKGVDKIQTLTCQDWLQSYSVLEQVDSKSEIWFANHYDRWAILFSNLKSKTKVLLQHGIVNNTSKPPNMLKGISSAYLIAKEQKQFVLNHFVANDFNTYILKDQLKLSNIVTKDKFRVLIVGNIGMYASNEKKIISFLNKKPVHLILKPHPVLPFGEYLTWKKQYNYHLIEDKNVFPEVDLVISYESTMGVEYAQKGIEVIYYNDKSVEEIIKTISNKAKAHKV